MPKPNVADLVDAYERNRDEMVRSDSSYNESDVRSEYIDPLFRLLGWDVTNIRGAPLRLRQVIREESVAGEDEHATSKRPDYTFRLGFQRKFFVEAKRPNVRINMDNSPAQQVRRYGWNANLLVSVLTNFEHLLIFDTTLPPQDFHTASFGRLHKFEYSEYADRWEEIYNLVSNEAVISGRFDEHFSDSTVNRESERIDARFLRFMNDARLRVATDLARQHPGISTGALNDLSQRLLLRMAFLRMAEDRDILPKETLLGVVKQNDWEEFTTLLVESDQRFDSELFDTSRDPFCNEGLEIAIDALKAIAEGLYYPESPWDFSVIEPEFLGSVYEQFLLQRVAKHGSGVILEPKPENVDRDVVFTPLPVVEAIVEESLAPRLRELPLDALRDVKILDPACGSGGFLVTAFDALCSTLVSAMEDAGEDETLVRVSSLGKRLPFSEKVKVLQSSIFGVDRDYLAAEVARFSLVVKLLEDETEQSLPDIQPLLPKLGRQIVAADALVDERVYSDEDDYDPELWGSPLTWSSSGLPEKFDFVIGNPPYLKTESIVNLEPTEGTFYVEHYQTAQKQYDKYYLFVERAIKDWLKVGGRFGMILSRKFTHIESGRELRKLISNEAVVEKIIDFGSAQIFSHRTTYTCLLFFRKDSAGGNDGIKYSLVTSPRDWIAQIEDREFFELPRSIAAGADSWLLPGTAEELRLLQRMLENSVRLEDVADVFNGIQTSAEDVYVIIPTRKASDYVYFLAGEREERAVERELVKPYYRGNIQPLKSFAPLPETAYVIFPYDVIEKDGKQEPRLIPLDELKSRYPKGHAWLLKHQTRLRDERSNKQNPFTDEDWHRYGRTQALTSFQDREKIVVGVQQRGDKYVLDETNTFLASGGTAGECAIAHPRDQSAQSSYSLHFILALLNHKAVEYFCRKRGSPFRGTDWYARGTAVLKKVPVPKIDFSADEGDERLSLYHSIVRGAKRLIELQATIAEVYSEGERETLRRKAEGIHRAVNYKISQLYGVEDLIDTIELPS